MSRPQLAADLAQFIEGEVCPRLSRAVAALERMKVDILDPDDANGQAWLGAMAELSAISQRLDSGEVKDLLERAKGGRQ